MPDSSCNCSTSAVLDGRGRSVIVFFCKRDVKKGEEFFFDYGGQFNLEWKNKLGY